MSPGMTDRPPASMTCSGSPRGTLSRLASADGVDAVVPDQDVSRSPWLSACAVDDVAAGNQSPSRLLRRPLSIGCLRLDLAKDARAAHDQPRSALRGRGDDVAESDRPCRAAQLDQTEVPGRRGHRAPLLTLSAHVEGAVSQARCPAVPALPAPDLRHGQMRDPRLNK